MLVYQTKEVDENSFVKVHQHEYPLQGCRWLFETLNQGEKELNLPCLGCQFPFQRAIISSVD